MNREGNKGFCCSVLQRPLVPKAAGGGGATGSERVSDAPGSSSGAQSARSQVPLAAQKAKLLEAHVPSLKRRRLGECGPVVVADALIRFLYVHSLPEGHSYPTPYLLINDMYRKRTAL